MTSRTSKSKDDTKSECFSIEPNLYGFPAQLAQISLAVSMTRLIRWIHDHDQGYRWTIVSGFEKSKGAVFGVICRVSDFRVGDVGVLWKASNSLLLL